MSSTLRTRNQLARADKTRVIRRRIIAAATELFVRDGYLETTMAGLAEQAGVAVQTLYLSFGGKAAVLAAALDDAVAGDDERVPEREWFARLHAEPDGAAALTVFVEAAAQVVARHYPLYASVAAAAADPEPAELLRRAKRRRLETHGRIVDELVGKRGFSEALSLDRATEVVHTLMSPETYGLLVVDHGWTGADWALWVERHLRVELFPLMGVDGPIER